MKKFKLYNNITGWVVFAIAAATYLLTKAPTSSLWDCSEFLASSYKLEVGHPPGAPLFNLTARVFSLFAKDASHVAAMVNSMSALFSAFTILFLFWTITHLVRKLIVKDENDFTPAKMIAILGSGAVGALAYTFSDTFWFSAVESEVYAYSSFFTAIVFWLILKWEDHADESTSWRWIILIAYMMGLSIGVHLLNLLAIPAIVLVYYFKKYKPTTKGVILAVITAMVIFVSVLYGLIPGLVKVASWFELFFVNVFGMHFNSGELIYIIVLALLLGVTIYLSQKDKDTILLRILFLLSVMILGIPFLGNGIILGLLISAGLGIWLFTRKSINVKVINLIVVSMAVMSIGYSSYTMVVIRSLANPPMDQNSADDVFALKSYLNRDQYGDNPLIYGPVYNAPPKLRINGNMCETIDVKGAPIWQRAEKKSPTDKDRYVKTGYRSKGIKYDSRFMMLFPRMYSQQSSHIQGYKQWGGSKGTPITVNQCGRDQTINCPTFGENLRYFFTYQLGFMYWRYFMWNFSGRQNDLQSYGEIDRGNWISGIPFVDNPRLGDQSKMPDTLKNNRGHNRYYMLPLLLGLIGIFWQLSKKTEGSKSFWLVFTLFFMTGIAIVLYLNQTPYQPRERDYAYAGSFYAFAIWIGFGVMGVYEALKKVSPKTVAAIVATLASLCVPALMGAQNWNDHDRSGRYTPRDIGYDYLQSCAPNSILFCNGDNDTFPLWYNQEVEGVRQDIRSVNLSYLATDWYIDQMKRQAYTSAPLPISWDHRDYVEGKLDVSRVNKVDQFKDGMDLHDAMKYIRQPNLIDDNGVGNFLSSKMLLPIDKDEVIATGTVPVKDSSNIVNQMVIPLGGTVNKSQLMFLDLLDENHWKRPMYVAVTVGSEFYPNIKPYLQLEGLAYRISPVKHDEKNMVNADAMYTNMMYKFKYGNIKDPHVYLEEQNMKMAKTFRMLFSQLADALIQENKKDSALAVLDKAHLEIPPTSVPYGYYAQYLAKDYYALNQNAKGDAIVEDLAKSYEQNIKWVLSLSPSKRNLVSQDMDLKFNLGMIQNLYLICSNAKSSLAPKMENLFKTYYPFIVQQGN